MTDQHILNRLAQLEAVNEIRRCLTRYMEICDGLNANTDLDELMALFSENAVWEGIGERYSKAFGRYEGKAKIAAMFESYMRKDAHFMLNAHFLNSENIQVQGQQAVGKWLMLQTSAFHQGGAHLTSAKLHIDFGLTSDNRWVMTHFRTENIFSRTVGHWSDQQDLPVPQQSAAN